MDKEVVCMYKGILLSHKRNKVMPFEAKQMDLNTIILNKSDTERQISYDIPYMWNLKKVLMNLITKQK